MVKLERYTGEKTYVLGNGELGTRARILEMCPAALSVVHVAETDLSGECLLAFDALSRLRSVWGIDPALGVDEAIAALEQLRNAPPAAPEPDAAERLAAALEFQTVLALAARQRGGDAA